MHSFDKLNKPLVSVIITCYNREKEIQRAIASVRWQTYVNIELIVVDDSSIDKSVEKILTLKDPTISLIRHSVNQGQNAAIRSGLELCTGEYVAFLDSDDIWLPNYLENMIGAFDDGIGMTYCWMVGGIRSYLTESNSYREVLVQGYLSNLNTLVVRSKVLNADDCFPNLVGPLRVCQDDILCFAIARYHRFKLVPMQLAVSLPAQNSMTQQSNDLAVGLEILFFKQKQEILDLLGYLGLAKRRLALSQYFFLVKSTMRGVLHVLVGGFYLFMSIPEYLAIGCTRFYSRPLSQLSVEILLSLLRSLRRRV